MPRKPQPQPAPIQPTLLIQTIKTVWSKAARSGAAADARNRVPWSLPMVGIGGDLGGATVIHTVAYGEANDFAAPLHSALEIESGIAKRQIQALRIEPSLAELRVAATWSSWAGAPVRHPIPHLMTLAPGAWGQVAYNLRSGGDLAWTYQLFVINIGLLVDAAPDCFTATAPFKAPRFLADLW